MKVLPKITLLALAAGLLTGTISSCKKDPLPETFRYQLDENKSLVTWEGTLRAGDSNTGTLAVHSEELVARDGQVQSGTFVLPLSSLRNLNLPDNLKPVLVHHLQSADFFDMALHPNLRFAISSVAPYTGGTAGAVAGANYLVTGDLTLLNQTHPISFPAKINLTTNRIAVLADLTVDRTRWGITYAADPALPASQHILPDIKLHLDVQGDRK